jgi:hypothetical protein
MIASERILHLQKDEFGKYCESFDLDPSHFGKVFSHNKEEYKLIGFDLTRNETPLRVVTISGKTAFLSVDALPSIVK